MKISKLFHSLYGALMLLPIAIVGSATLVSTFNQNVNNVESTQIQYKYETNDVNSINDVVLKDNIYKFDIDFEKSMIENFYIDYDISEHNDIVITMQLIKFDYIRFSSNALNEFEESYFEFEEYGYYANSLYLSMYFNTYSYFVDVMLYYPIDAYDIYQSQLTSFYNVLDYYVDMDDSFFISDCYVVIDGIDNWDSATLPNIIKKSDYIPIESAEINNYNVVDVMQYQVQHLYDNPLLSWVKNTPIGDVYSYIGGVFNVPSDSFINYSLTYWTSISIIYLVFDLVMYVPLLVHKWIDKGMVE